MRLKRFFLAFFLLAGCAGSQAGNQKNEPLAASVQAALQAAIADRASPEPQFSSLGEKVNGSDKDAKAIAKAVKVYRTAHRKAAMKAEGIES